MTNASCDTYDQVIHKQLSTKIVINYKEEILLILQDSRVQD